MADMQKYREVVELLKERLLAELRDQIQAIILFGSVARGDATEESDIDILIITEAPFSIRQRMDEISYNIDLDKEVFTHLVFFTTQGFEKEVVTYRSYFSSDVINQGVVLYDDGTFQRIRKKAASAIPGIPG